MSRFIVRKPAACQILGSFGQAMGFSFELG